MLDSDTKRRIDTARDILVGKVPDPKSQVEQITIALIYKFMEDMDAEAEELGSPRKFFTGEFEKYSWSKLVASSTGGHEMLALYAEAITKMTQNENIPALFRDIFKNAFLPYRDPETLREFLKIIDKFEYDHSERLGDAFEYLLSVLGSQGDAGQFRTPRHIIDFMVEIVDPKKDETVLDPACGTAGFLISSYKHILAANSKDGRKGASLTPDERKKLIENFSGYDISPDMVRLSLVNLYLHGFTKPNIEEYDTLTSEDKWNEYSDIVLANPPFMSPKGGIKPHKRFSIKAKRSEVLFVDYIAEHLTPNGRAAVIVPEGIIFQSQNAYKQLREMLIKDHLYGVVSLPAGVFQPYSGVKTSILLMDKTLAKKCDSVLFVKIEHDGFDLGAQRRPNEKDDLPEALSALQDFKQCCVSGQTFDAERYSTALKVSKEEIGADGEWGLNAERYRKVENLDNSRFEMVQLEDICEIARGGSPRPIQQFITNSEDGINWIKIGDVAEGEKYITQTKQKIKPEGLSKTRTVQVGDFLLSNSMSFGRPYIMKIEGAIHDGWLLIRMTDKDKIVQDYLYWLLGSNLVKEQYNQFAVGGVVKNLNSSLVRRVKIPLPPLKIQQEIVAELEGYQAIIDGARAVVDSYKPQIQIDPDWDMVKLENLLSNEKYSIKAGPFGSSLKKEFYVESGYKIYGQEQVIKGDMDYGNYYINEEKFQELKSCKIQTDDILISLVGTIGKILVVPKEFEKGIINPRLIKITLDKCKITSHFFTYYFQSDAILSQVKRNAGGGTMPVLNGRILKALKFPVPPLEIQQEIVAQIEKEQALVNGNKKLITLFEQKIKDKIASVWGEEGKKAETSEAVQIIEGEKVTA